MRLKLKQPGLWRLQVLLISLSVTLLAGCDLVGGMKRGSINVTSDPSGVQLLLNGEPQGETPAIIADLVPGEYLLELRKDGFERTYKQIVLLEGQEFKLDLKLKKTKGLLLVESNPIGADVLIEGVSKGNTPLLLTDLPLGSHSVELRSTARLPQVISVDLEGRTPVRAFAKLDSNTATLTVTSLPVGAEVFIDGNMIGVTPVTVENVQPGESMVKVSKGGYRPYTNKMTFEANKPYKVAASLDALPSGLTVISMPEGAKIMIDNLPMGTAPLTRTDLKEGAHTITATLDGYASQTQTIELEPDTTDSIEFNLVKDSGTLVVDTEPAYVDIYVNGKLLKTTQPKGNSEAISQPVRIMLKAGRTQRVQFVREGYVSSSATIETEIDQLVTRHVVLKRIFVYDTKITTKDEIIKCRIEYKLPTGDIYYERMPGIYDTAKAADIIKVEPIQIDDESNRAARRLIEQNKQSIPE